MAVNPVLLGVNVDRVAALRQAGHKLRPIAARALVTELNIGHTIVADAFFIGLSQAVGDCRRAMLEARAQGS